MKRLMMCLVIVALAIPVMADGADNFSYGTAITSAGDTVNIRASYKLYETDSVKIFALRMTDVSVHGDLLWAFESDRWGVGISARARTIGIPVVDNLLDIAHIDGVGIAGILRDTDISLSKIELCVYAVTDVQF